MSTRSFYMLWQIQGYAFQTVSGFIGNAQSKSIVLRHDVDALPANSLRLAQIQSMRGILGTYYFRTVPASFDEDIIGKIDELGHEIGYHYECLSTCNGNLEKAFADFALNLEKLRKLAPVSTICMHGSPRSPWDSRDLWKTYDYRKLGIVGEPYLDLDFGQVFYLTDTGRRWDGWKVSVRDKIDRQGYWASQGLVFKSTWEIIRAAERGILPDKIMITVHPQRWHDRPWPWMREFVLQRIKNGVKCLMIKYRSKKKRNNE